MSLSISTPQFVHTGITQAKHYGNVAKGAASKPVAVAKSKPALTSAAGEILTGVGETFLFAYALDSLTFVLNKRAALAARDERLEAFLEACSDKDLTPMEMELLAKTVPTLRRPERMETFKALTKRHVNRAVRSAKITGWAYYTVYSSVFIVPVSAVAWGQYFATKAVNVVVANRHMSPARQFKGMERDTRALLRRRRMHSWVFGKTTLKGWNNMKPLWTPTVREFYTNLPTIENGAIVYFDTMGRVTRKISFAPNAHAAEVAKTVLERDEEELFSPYLAGTDEFDFHATNQQDGDAVSVTTESSNDLFTERKKISFDTDVQETKQRSARETAEDLLAKRDDISDHLETVENWQLILEGGDGFSKVGYDRIQLAFDKVIKTLPENIEQDDPRVLGAALANQVKLSKRSQLSAARKALPFWVLANLNDIDPTKLDDEDASAAFIDFTDKNGLLILQGWDDIVSRNFASV